MTTQMERIVEEQDTMTSSTITTTMDVLALPELRAMRQRVQRAYAAWGDTSRRAMHARRKEGHRTASRFTLVAVAAATRLAEGLPEEREQDDALATYLELSGAYETRRKALLAQYADVINAGDAVLRAQVEREQVARRAADLAEVARRYGCLSRVEAARINLRSGFTVDAGGYRHAARLTTQELATLWTS